MQPCLNNEWVRIFDVLDLSNRSIPRLSPAAPSIVSSTMANALMSSNRSRRVGSPMRVASCFRRMKQTGLQVRPMFHWTSRRIEAHVKLCVLALQVQRAAEMRCQLPWARIAHVLSGLKAVRYRCEGRGIVQRTKITAELSAKLKTLKVSVPKQILLVEESPSATTAA